MKTTIKVWIKPVLIILVRTRSEEAVLMLCKDEGCMGKFKE